jgi:transcription factor SFP1
LLSSLLPFLQKFVVYSVSHLVISSQVADHRSIRPSGFSMLLHSHSTSPPPLSHSPRESTAASTPISTPPLQQPASPQFGRYQDPSAGHLHSGHRKPHQLVGSRLIDSDVLFEDAGDCSFSLFPESPQLHSALQAMAQTAAPLDIQTPPRFGSNSPQNTSNLTAALKAEANRDSSATPSQLNPYGYDTQRPGMSERHPSVTMLGSSYYGNGARPISMKDRPRRESTNMGSLAGGMSWGGVSVGSWIRDE